jgi:hypothetical protein
MKRQRIGGGFDGNDCFLVQETRRGSDFVLGAVLVTGWDERYAHGFSYYNLAWNLGVLNFMQDA